MFMLLKTICYKPNLGCTTKIWGKTREIYQEESKVWKDFKHTPRWNGDVWECYKRAYKTFKWIPILKLQSPWVFQKIGSRSFGPKPLKIELSLTFQKVLKKTTIVWVSFCGKKDTLHELYGNLKGQKWNY